MPRANEREDKMTTLHAAIFLAGKSCFRCADADDIEKRSRVGLCLLRVFSSQERSSTPRPMTEKEMTTLPGTVASLTMTTTSSFSCHFPFLPSLSSLVQQ